MKKGLGVSKGYAIGIAYVINTQEDVCFDSVTQNPAEESDRLNQAILKSKEQVSRIACKARQNLNKKNAEIIESQLNFLDDPAFTGEAFSKIKQDSVSAEKAISDITQSLYDMFSGFDDEYTKERAADIKDVGGRILTNLSGRTKDIDFENLPQNTILFAHDLKPSDTAQIDKQKVTAFVTEVGGKTSHTAILAKALGIAAVVGCGEILNTVKTGMTVIVDGVSGDVIISPDKTTIEKYSLLSEKLSEHKAELAASTQKSVCTKCGKNITVAANIGGLEDLKTALLNGADGVGLFRTEFIYMNRQEMPSEEEQFSIYKEAAEMLDGKPLTIRTLDIGGDKSLPYFKIPKESNPFLGMRAIRLCLKNPDIFKTQLRAILRASAFGNIQIMFPMISSIKELECAKEILEICKNDLKRDNINYNPSVKIGMMIEIPAAALIADEFAEKVNFFSIGTNDLTQYTLAVDRMNENISELYDQTHPAVLRLIKMTINAAHNASIPCYMCGELASDEKTIPLLLEYGLDEFSVSPGALLETKSKLLEQV